MPGWMKSNPAASLFGLVLVLTFAVCLAEESGGESLPEGFLEFLAEWEDEQGEWQDPMVYEGREWQELDRQVEQTDE